MMFWFMTVVLAIGGYLVMTRRPAHTRMHLLAGAVIGGGVGGALFALIAALRGANFGDVLPYAFFGLLQGAFVGVVGLSAFAVGDWLGRRP
jgi:hypothetical protein